jgi:ribosomal subunit interface protein
MMRIQLEMLHVEDDAKIVDYVNQKIGKLDHLLSRHAQRSAHADVKLKKGPGRGKKQFTCEVVVHLPQEFITTSQTAESLSAAVDLAEAKLKNQLIKYKDKHVLSRRNRLRRFMMQLRRRG